MSMRHGRPTRPGSQAQHRIAASAPFPTQRSSSSRPFMSSPGLYVSTGFPLKRRLSPLLLTASLAALSIPVADAKPEWAKPYLELPTPRGPFIAKNDRWVVVRGEVEFAYTDDKSKAIETRHRLLIENVSDRTETFTAVIRFDGS